VSVSIIEICCCVVCFNPPDVVYGDSLALFIYTSKESISEIGTARLQILLPSLLGPS